jgi:hypothetical protein
MPTVTLALTAGAAGFSLLASIFWFLSATIEVPPPPTNSDISCR